MSKYKKIMLNKGIMQKEVLDNVRRVDPRVDKPLLSKIVNDVVLPNKPTLESICKTLSCDVLDIYDPREIYLAPAETPQNNGVNTVATATERTRARRVENDFYNLTVEIPREQAERVFSKSALRLLGYLSKTDFVRQAVDELDKRLKAKEKAERKNAVDGK